MQKHELGGVTDVWDRIAALRVRSLDVLAPKMRVAVEAALKECHRASATFTRVDGDPETIPLDVTVHETLRTDELQRIYYEQRTTRASSALYSWHAYGLAVDVVSASYGWFTGKPARERWPDARNRARACDAWFTYVAAVFIEHGMDWGGDWKDRDLPHFQWGTLKPTPSDRARELYAAGGRERVWSVVDAA